ncbi:hypothetical protein [Pseudoclavibacter helvolus]|uniref:hypothetical protein n=1 Tax=Pseudoclavibacter helvolus TaxID=255205 RepID=UPI003736755B
MSHADTPRTHDHEGSNEFNDETTDEGSVGAGGAIADGAIAEALGTDQPLISDEGSVGAGGASADGTRS